MNSILKHIRDYGIVPTVKIEDAKHAVPLARALVDGGLPVAEITFRSNAAEKALAEIASSIPEVLLGAGTVLTVEQAQKAVAAGAMFIVSPGFNTQVVQYCVDNRIPIIPGCCTPTDIEAALSFGLNVVKFFPAEKNGGIGTMKAFGGPYPNVYYLPTGGVNDSNIKDYICFPKTLAVGGSWMVSPELIINERFEEVSVLTRDAIKKLIGFEFAHIGINVENTREALKIARLLTNLFDFNIREGNSSIFAGSGIEICKGNKLGKKHIAVSTNSIIRAAFYLGKRGVTVDPESAKMKDGQMVAIYLKDKIGEFSVHLLQK